MPSRLLNANAKLLLGFFAVMFPPFGCSGSGNEPLPEQMHPGVRLGADRLTKTMFAAVDNLGPITDIQRGELRSPGKVEIGIAGAYGARFFDDHGVQRAAVDFANRRPEGAWVSAKIVKQTRANGVLFFRQSGNAAVYDSLTDFHGIETWRTPYSTLGSAFGDLTGNGVPSFVFAGQDRAVEARNLAGVVVWRHEGVGWATRLAVIQPENGGPAEILMVVKGNLVGLSQFGEPLFDRKPAVDGYFSDFSPVKWLPICPLCLLVSNNDHLDLLTLDGSSAVKQLDAGYMQDASAIAVRLNENAPPLLAVGGFLGFKGGHWAGYQAVGGALYIFDLNGNLVYQEVFPERLAALGVVPSVDGKTETLLVGGENKVWAYSQPQSKSSR